MCCNVVQHTPGLLHGHEPGYRGDHGVKGELVPTRCQPNTMPRVIVFVVYLGHTTQYDHILARSARLFNVDSIFWARIPMRGFCQTSFGKDGMYSCGIGGLMDG